MKGIPSKGFLAAVGALIGLSTAILIIAYANGGFRCLLFWPLWIAYSMKVNGWVWHLFAAFGPLLYIALWSVLAASIGSLLRRETGNKMTQPGQAG